MYHHAGHEGDNMTVDGTMELHSMLNAGIVENKNLGKRQDHYTSVLGNTAWYI